MAIVTIFSCFERFLGFIYRVYLSRVLGSESVGLYQITLSVLGLFMTITSSGIPVTVSRTMIKYREKNQSEKIPRVISSAVVVSTLISLGITALVFLKSPLISLLFSDKRCERLLVILIPGLVITSVYAVARGSFWGNERFLTYSVVELLEEAVMVASGVALVGGATDSFGGAKRACFAVLISYAFSFSTATILYFAKGGKLGNPRKELRPLFLSSAPITGMRTETSAINALIAALLPSRLIRYGMSEQMAISEFGRVFGMAMPLCSIPSAFVGSLALALVPELSSNFYSGKYATLKNHVEKAVKVSTFIVCLIIPPFLVLGEDIGFLVYADQTVGKYVVQGSLIMLPSSVSLIATSILNSLNKEKKTLVFYLIGSAFLIASIFFLPKYLGVGSLILGLTLSFSVTALLNLSELTKACPQKPRIKKYILFSLAIVLFTAAIGVFLRNILSIFLSRFLKCVVVSCAVDLLVLFAFFVFGGLDFNPDKKPSKAKAHSEVTAKTNKTNRHLER